MITDALRSQLAAAVPKLQPGTLPHDVDVALSEIGYVHCVKPPSPRHPVGTTFAIAAGMVPRSAVHKAMLLSQLRRFGADYPARCYAHANAHGRHLCPGYPVGALLAGATPGCPR